MQKEFKETVTFFIEGKTREAGSAGDMSLYETISRLTDTRPQTEFPRQVGQPHCKR